MAPCEITSTLAKAKAVPAGALQSGMDCADDIASAVASVIDRAATGAFLLPPQRRLLIRGLHVLAAARHTKVCQPLLRLLRRPEDECDRCLGLGLTETLSGVLLGIYDGHVEMLFAAIEDRAVHEYARWSLLTVAARLTFDGRIARQGMHALLERFEAEGWAEAEDAAWEGWQDAIRLLGFDDLAPRVRATWDDGRNPQDVPDRLNWEDGLADAIANPAGVQRFVEDRLQPIDDPVAALAHLEGEQDPKTDEVNIASDAALDADEIDWLGEFLDHHQAPMTVEALDGYFTALIVGPKVVPPSQYMTAIWGDGAPVFDDREQVEYVMALLTRHWNSIASRLEAMKPLAPIMAEAELEAQAWADGFMHGVAPRMAIWDRRIAKDPELCSFLGHILMLTVSAEDAEKEGITGAERARMVESLSLAVHGIRMYWRERPLTANEGNSRPSSRRGKIGRNEPCPCGSGKKYKRCCGASDVTVH